jgi:hypothetical protein
MITMPLVTPQVHRVLERRDSGDKVAVAAILCAPPPRSFACGLVAGA